jgi:site-specific DNA recombinase
LFILKPSRRPVLSTKSGKSITAINTDSRLKRKQDEEDKMNSTVKRVAVYARVSSDRQDTDLSISAQLKALREYASRNGCIVVREFVDEAESGRTADRPAFREMISMARRPSKPFELILVWKYSRFARSREDSIVYKTLLRKNGVQVVSITEPFEDTPTGRLLEAIIESLDEFYSANLGQEIIRGMRESASRGFFLDRPCALWLSQGKGKGRRQGTSQAGG